MDDTFDRVKTILVDQLGVEPDEIERDKSDSTKIDDDLGADSLDFIEITMSIETEFVIDVPDVVAEKVQTVGDLVRMVESLQVPS